MASRYRNGYTCDAESDLAIISPQVPSGDIAYCIAEGSYWKKTPGGWVLGGSGTGVGDIVGPASAVTARLASFNGTTGKLLQDSGKLATDFAASVHTHAESDVTNLVTDLAAKAPVNAFITLTSNYTTSSGSTALQKLFNAPANGAFTAAANTTYFFECGFGLTAMSASSGTYSFGLGGTATYTRVAYIANANKAAASASASLVTRGAVATITALVAANTTTTGQAFVSGKVVIGTGGTIIPSFAISVASAAVVMVDSYFRIWAAGSDTVQSLGSWA